MAAPFLKDESIIPPTPEEQAQIRQDFAETLSGKFDAETVDYLVNTSAGRRLLSEHSPVFFDVYYCGMDYAEFRERWLNEYEEVYERAKKRKSKEYLLRLAPRDHGKTVSLTTFVVRSICRNRNIRVLWICATQEPAVKRLKIVKDLLNSPAIVEDWCSAPEEGYGPFWSEGSGDPNTKKAFYVQRTKLSIDPTLEASSSGGDITGGHFDIVIGDDIENDITTLTASRRAKTRNWFFGTVNPILSNDLGGALLMVGTRKHYDDLYAHLEKRKALWTIVNDPAVIKWPDSYRYTYEMGSDGIQKIDTVEYEGEAIVLFPDRRPFEKLMIEKYNISDQIFFREFQNQVQDDGAAPFKTPWLDKAKERGELLRLGHMPTLPDGERFISAVWAWDVTVVESEEKAQENDNDFSVGFLWGRTNMDNRYLIDAVRFRGLSQQQKVDLFVKMYRKWDRVFPGFVQHVVIEKNAFGQLYIGKMKRETDVPVCGHLTGTNKNNQFQGVPMLIPLFENGKVILPYGDEESRSLVDTLCAELWGLGKEAHDDTVMCLWIAETKVRASFSHAVAFGPGENDVINGGGLQSQEDQNRPSGILTPEEATKTKANSMWGNLDVILNRDSLG